MLSKEENEFLTRVGPGTPAGTLLRRYWHPVAAAGEITEERPLKAVKLLGENLVWIGAGPKARKYREFNQSRGGKSNGRKN